MNTVNPLSKVPYFYQSNTSKFSSVVNQYIGAGNDINSLSCIDQALAGSILLIQWQASQPVNKCTKGHHTYRWLALDLLAPLRDVHHPNPPCYLHSTGIQISDGFLQPCYTHAYADIS